MGNYDADLHMFRQDAREPDVRALEFLRTLALSGALADDMRPTGVTLRNFDLTILSSTGPASLAGPRWS